MGSGRRSRGRLRHLVGRRMRCCGVRFAGRCLAGRWLGGSRLRRGLGRRRPGVFRLLRRFGGGRWLGCRRAPPRRLAQPRLAPRPAVRAYRRQRSRAAPTQQPVPAASPPERSWSRPPWRRHARLAASRPASPPPGPDFVWARAAGLPAGFAGGAFRWALSSRALAAVPDAFMPDTSYPSICRRARGKSTAAGHRPCGPAPRPDRTRPYGIATRPALVRRRRHCR